MQFFLQNFESSTQPAFDGFNRDMQRLGDFVVFKALESTEAKYHP